MTFYLTTPLYYVNDTPHIGHAYTTVVADALTRYHRLFGDESRMLTGTDEHGQKIQNAASKRGKTPQEHCDEFVVRFQEIWKELEINYDIFFRTTDHFHIQAVQTALSLLYEKGDIYDDDYEGWYCVSEEIFYQEKDLLDGKSPNGNEVTRITEKNYFFRMSKYQQRLMDWIETHPEFIQPNSKKKEILGFLKQPLEDLCISRPKNRLTWGIEIPFAPDYVTYVWFDALLNYATGVGFLQPEREAEYQKWWCPPHGGAIHLIGKDILMTHAVYWPTILMALEAPLPKQIFAHGWWLTSENEKMAKSRGTGVSPLDVKEIVGVDALRYFLCRDIYLGNDAQFSVDLVVARVNAELANNLGNLLSRTTQLIAKYFENKIPTLTFGHTKTKVLLDFAVAIPPLVKKEIEQMAPNMAIEKVILLLNEANRYLEEIAPWKEAKNNLPLAGESLRASLEVLRIAAILLYPVMPEKILELLKRIGWSRSPCYADSLQKDLLQEGTAIETGKPLFPRI